jgi:hypothetical protein
VTLYHEFARLQARDKVLTEALERISKQQQHTLGWLESNGIVFDGPLGKDPKNWQHVAFSIYSDLCEVDIWAHHALGKEFGSEPPATDSTSEVRRDADE